MAKSEVHPQVTLATKGGEVLHDFAKHVSNCLLLLPLQIKFSANQSQNRNLIWLTEYTNKYTERKLHDSNKESAQSNKPQLCRGLRRSVAAQRRRALGICDLLLNQNNSATRNKYWFSLCFYRRSGSTTARRDGQLYSLIVSYDSMCEKRRKKKEEKKTWPDVTVWEFDKRRSGS